MDKNIIFYNNHRKYLFKKNDKFSFNIKETKKYFHIS